MRALVLIWPLLSTHTYISLQVLSLLSRGRAQFSHLFDSDHLVILPLTLSCTCLGSLRSGSSLRFLGCAQNAHWEGDIYAQCNQYNSWVPTLLGCIPPLARMLQCLQRWRESGMRIQLINAGKVHLFGFLPRRET